MEEARPRVAPAARPNTTPQLHLHLHLHHRTITNTDCKARHHAFTCTAVGCVVNTQQRPKCGFACPSFQGALDVLSLAVGPPFVTSKPVSSTPVQALANARQRSPRPAQPRPRHSLGLNVHLTGPRR